MSRRSVIVRLLISLVVMAALSAGCAGAPDLTERDEAMLSARAVAEICAVKCDGLTIYVVGGHVFGSVDEVVGDEPAMSAEMMSAIDGQLSQEVLFIDRLQVNALVIGGVLVDRNAIIVFVGPVTWLSSEVVGVAIGSHIADDGAWGGIQQFRWTGQAWEPADPEDIGITVTTSVS